MGKIKPFKIIGISIETTNKNGKSAQDLAKLWGKFYAENISSKISNKINEDIYSIYTDYKTDYTEKYTSIIGLKVSSLNEIPSGLIGREFHGSNYQKFIAKGQMPNAVVQTWQNIWQKDKELNRKYTADFEVYTQQSCHTNGENAEVEIYIAV